MNAPDPGIYFDVPDAEYRAWPYVSQSTLGMFRDPDLCELEIRHRIEHPQEPTESMTLGLTVETALHDPSALGACIKQLPPEIKARRGAAYEALKEQNPGVEFLPRVEYEKRTAMFSQARAMAASIQSHDLAARLMDGARRQAAFVWDAEFVGESGKPVVHRVKGLLDYWNEELGAIADLKCLSAGGQRSVGRHVWQYAYDVQSALYTDAMRSLTKRADLEFYFIVCRSIPPYVVTLYSGHNTTEMAGHLLAIGRSAYQIYLERLAECNRTGQWNGYTSPDAPGARVLDVQLPPWAA